LCLGMDGGGEGKAPFIAGSGAAMGKHDRRDREAVGVHAVRLHEAREAEPGRQAREAGGRQSQREGAEREMPPEERPEARPGRRDEDQEEAR